MLLPLTALMALMFFWSSPLLSTPTAEAALFFGVFLAPLSFFAGACRGALRNTRGFRNDVFKESAWVFGTALGLLSILWLHGLTQTSCSPSVGIWPFVILLTPQLFLNLVSGVWVGRLLAQVKLTVIVCLILCLGYLWLQISLWWLNPSMRFFDPYWLMITGELISGQSLTLPVIVYRMSGLFYGLALFLLGTSFRRHATQFWLVFALFGFAAMMQYKSSALISPSLSQRRAAYPDLLAKGPLVLHTNLETIGKEHAEAILQEGTLWLARLKERTGLDSHKPIHIWLYANSESLAHFTGAKNIHFALPTHREIHVSGTEIPHPTLGHELAHIVLGQMSNTLWDVPGIWEFLPNWGLSEGLATYLTPELNIREDLSTQQQAFALYRLGLETEPEDLLSPDFGSFWAQSSQRAYTASAAILEVYIDAQCQDLSCRQKLIQALAKAGDITWSPEFLKSYYLRMKTESLPPDALPSVFKQFQKNSILMADCSVVSASKEPELDIDLSKLPPYKQRELMIKKAFSRSNASYAQAGLDLLSLQSPAAYAWLGLSLLKPTESDIAYDYAAYLLARIEILGGNFKLGLDWMPTQLEGFVGQEAKRVSALAKSQIGWADQAATEFDLLKTEASRPADILRFGDMAERARQISLGERFLLGVW